MITLFTTPRLFQDPFTIPQKNAIRSWAKLKPKCEIILFGKEEGTAQIAAEVGARYVPEIELNEFGTPLIGTDFNMARKLASNPLICELSGDIILFNNFAEAILKMPKVNFLMVGRRWDLKVEEEINFNDENWENGFQKKIKKGGKMHGPTGSDYFVFPKNAFGEIPPFIIGSPGWDNWFIYKARALKMPVIDTTEMVTAIHQVHDRPRKKQDFFKIERQRNLKLAGGLVQMASLRDADWVLTSRGLERPKFPRIIFSKLSLFYPWRLLLALKRIIFRLSKY